jgi:hypothetical protein
MESLELKVNDRFPVVRDIKQVKRRFSPLGRCSGNDDGVICLGRRHSVSLVTQGSGLGLSNRPQRIAWQCRLRESLSETFGQGGRGIIRIQSSGASGWRQMALDGWVDSDIQRGPGVCFVFASGAGGEGAAITTGLILIARERQTDRASQGWGLAKLRSIDV